MSSYAEGTSVPVERSKAEIEAILTRYGAEQFMYGWSQSEARIMFRVNGRVVRMILPLPPKEEFRLTPAKRLRRSDAGISKAWEQACRERWRSLGLVLKAKLEAVRVGITTFDDEFLAFIQLPNGQTVGEFYGPQIEGIYDRGLLPALLPGLGDGRE